MTNSGYDRLVEKLKKTLSLFGFETHTAGTVRKEVKVNESFGLVFFTIWKPEFGRDSEFSHLKLEMTVFLDNHRDYHLMLAMKFADVKPEKAGDPGIIQKMLAELCGDVAGDLGDVVRTAGVAAMTGGI